MFVMAFEISSRGASPEEDTASWRDRVLPVLRGHSGFDDAMLLTSHEDQAILVLTFWDSEEDLRRAQAMLPRDLENAGNRVPPTEIEHGMRTYEVAFRDRGESSSDDVRASVSAAQTDVDTRLAFENRQQGQRYVTKAVLRLRRADAHGLQIEARGRYIDRVEVWPTGAATAVMSVEEQLGLPNVGIVKINSPSAKAYDVTVYTTAPDSVELNVAILGGNA
jgi:heme-degrading monooxygenase HmoA